MSETLKIQFDDGRSVEAKLGDTILEAAHRGGVEIDHACGGVCACSTCHIKIESGATCLTEASDEEEDQLDQARDVGLNSRLACQCRIESIPDGANIDVKIPSWNVNLVREGGD